MCEIVNERKLRFEIDKKRTEHMKTQHSKQINNKLKFTFMLIEPCIEKKFNWCHSVSLTFTIYFLSFFTSVALLKAKWIAFPYFFAETNQTKQVLLHFFFLRNVHVWSISNAGKEVNFSNKKLEITNSKLLYLFGE